MPFDNLRDFKLSGPALPEPFVRLQLEDVLKKKKLLPAAKDVKAGWDIYRRHLRRLGEVGGSRRVKNHVLEPLVELLGYATIEQAQEVETREGPEDGGFVMKTANGSSLLRCWTAGVNTDLDAPTRRGRAFRFSLQNIALRVLWKQGERAGLITDGDELRLIIVNPSGRESFITFDLTRSGWRGAYTPPDSFRLFLALASPEGIAFIPDLTEQARLAQAEVTKTLRDQARNAITDFLQGVLQHYENKDVVSSFPIRYAKKHHRSGNIDYAEIADPAALANELWREGLVIVYRLLFILKLESSPDPARAFSFASTSLWRNTYSPNTALSSWVKVVLDERKDTGTLMEDGLRALFRLFVRGLKSSELHVSPLGGQLFGPDTTPLLDQLKWGEQSVALLLQHLLWTPETKKSPRMRVHYGYLDVEDLGRVYEALLEREPGIATERMCRLKRDKLEVVVPYAQGEAYRTATTKSKVEWVEEIPAGRFYLRVGLGRKSSGSYYTPDAFVKFLVQETLGPLSTERSPLADPHPAALLTIKVLDPAMGSGHFLVEACRFLGERLYEACRRCDELALALQAAADAKEEGKRIEDRAVLKELDQKLLDLSPDELRARADELYRRVEILPDPNDELLQYLPSRSVEGGETSGVSVWKARALCRRLVAVHCLYGVDKNPLAVELAKLVLWLESYSEGYPLTFLDHRLIQGDSLTGPFFKHLTTHPISGEPFDGLWSSRLEKALVERLDLGLREVGGLEASVGKDVADLDQKELAKQRLDALLLDLQRLAAAWSGAVMLGKDHAPDMDAVYEAAVDLIAGGNSLSDLYGAYPLLREIVETGREGVAYDLRFPEVFWRGGKLENRTGFDVVIGNPPWDKIRVEYKSIYSSFNPAILEADLHSEWSRVAERIQVENEEVGCMIAFHESEVGKYKNLIKRIYAAVGSGGDPDLYQMFVVRSLSVFHQRGSTGLITGGGVAKNPADTWLRLLLGKQASILRVFHFVNSAFAFPDLPPVVEFALLHLSRGFGSASQTIWMDLVSEHVLLEQKTPDQVAGLVPRSILLEWSGEETSAKDDEPSSVKAFLEQSCIKLGTEMHKSGLAHLSSNAPQDLVGEDLRQPSFSDSLQSRSLIPTYASLSFIAYDDLPLGGSGKRAKAIHSVVSGHEEKISRFIRSCRYFRLTLRDTCGSTKTNSRSVTAVVLRPGFITWNTCQIERTPEKRTNARMLSALATLNSFPVDYRVRQIVGVHVNPSILSKVAAPEIEGECISFLAHSALRLSCNHAGYEPLWREQLCYTPELEDTWREERPPFTWPVLEGDDARWKVRAAIDAVVAQAYGLTREQYEHILNSFSHKSYPAAKAMCLAAWDELHALGLDAFTKKHDPYHDIPLNEALPKPVINLPGLADLDGAEDDDIELADDDLFADDEDAEDQDAEEESRPTKKKPKPTPAKVVGVSNDWWVELIEVPAETLVRVTEPDLVEAAFDLGSEPEPAFGIRLLGDGRLQSGDPEKDTLVGLKTSDRTLGAKSLESIASTLHRAIGMEELPLDDRIEYRAGSRVHVVRVSKGGKVCAWKVPDGAWPKKYQDTIASLARALKAEAQKDRKE